jgi:hypothetical protein
MSAMNYRHYLPSLVLSTGVACLVITATFVFLQRSTRAHRKPQELPEIISKVESIEVVSTKIENENTDSVVAIIEVRNNSEKAIVAIAVESGNDRDSSGVSVNGFKSENEQPAVILEPNAILKIRFALANVKANAPIRISSVMYLDGTEKGEKAALGTLHRQKEHAKKTKKGALPQQ